VETARLSWGWLMIAALALVPVSIIEVSKLVKARRTRGENTR
jgi:hypothetical protein